MARHLCPQDDAQPDLATERMFFTHANGSGSTRCASRWPLAGGRAGQRDGRAVPAGAAALRGQLHQQHQRRLQGLSSRLGRPDAHGALSDRRSAIELRPPVLHDNGQANRVLRRMPSSWRNGRAIRARRSPSPTSIRPTISIRTAATIICSIAVVLWDKPGASPRLRPAPSRHPHRLAHRPPRGL